MQALILAAGKGTRLHYNKAKCTAPILDVPIISYMIKTLSLNDINDVKIVVGHRADDVREATKYKYEYIFQNDLDGTAGAVKSALPYLNDELLIILPGDSVVLDDGEIKEFINYHIVNNCDFSVLGIEKERPFGYGRIIEIDDRFQIVEESNLGDLKTNFCNSGIYITNKKILEECIFNIPKNGNGEYYFTDILKFLGNKNVGIYKANTPIYGINNLEDLCEVSDAVKLKINNALIKKGVFISDVNNTYISDDTQIGCGTFIEPGSVIYHSIIGKKNEILGCCRIINSIINDENYIESSNIKNTFIGNNNHIGPFCHMRNEVNIGNFNRIGNFVEIKASMIKDNTNAAHLAYIGNCDCGSGVNFGCGSITVNYDGKNKHKTVIKDKAFIGCNSNLVAPIIIEEKAFIAAGSTITNDVSANSLAIARARQINKEGYNKENTR